MMASTSSVNKSVCCQQPFLKRYAPVTLMRLPSLLVESVFETFFFLLIFNLGNAASSPVDAHGLQISIEALFVSICQKKHYLYRQNDRNKRCQKISQKIAQERKRLLEEIQRYNQQPDGDLVDTISVVQKLSNKAAESMIWPWQEQNTDGVDIITKKKLFDQLMLVSRLTEEKQILVKEMMQHCQYLKD
ncbi:uncharacterized protein LOC125253506 isoform X3 [Megalobrama amblycephala]|uniref:uncharacterized protein LOC125253506 isoform X3 n=1 Tax=Megalobrama amblycephala TaxID=75352 RepID=UPI002013F2CE|nr:uncharacterized protein LOC125253506 isoform X3 [Megalobrama amblycephala]